LNQALFDEVTWAQEDEPTQVKIHFRMHCCCCFTRQTSASIC